MTFVEIFLNAVRSPRLARVLSCFLCSLLTHGAASAQEWTFSLNETALNPSSIQIDTRGTQFQVLDMNGDGLPDFVVNDTGTLVYYEQTPTALQQWTPKHLSFPAVGLLQTTESTLPKNFRFVDWDADGDFDLAADSSLFWWNTGNNENPMWQQDKTLITGIPFGVNFSFLDYDADGDWDATCDVETNVYRTALFLNDGDNQTPAWTKIDTLIPHGFAGRFVHWNSDTLLDLASIEFLVGVGGSAGNAGFALDVSLNTGSRPAPQWQQTDSFLAWVAFGTNMQPGFDLFDFDRDGLLDVIKTDWHHHLAIHFNKGNSETPSFDRSPDRLLGPISVESNARPYFLDPLAPSTFVVTGDFLTDVLSVKPLPDGRIHAYDTSAGEFDPSRRLQEHVPRTEFESLPNLKKNLTLTFADVDNDGDRDYLLGFTRTDLKGHELSKSVLYYENTGTATAGDWQVASTMFERFQHPDSMFYDPQLADMDDDGDVDLLVQRSGEYTFYERLNSNEEQWRPNPSWMNGVGRRKHYSAALFDADRDGDTDLIFGETNGTLSLYQNIGSRAAPQWRHVPEAFADIHVDSLAAVTPHFLSRNGSCNLIVGNAAGRLFYYDNFSTVAVQDEDDAQPGQFSLLQNYPNPFNPETVIEYDLPAAGRVRLTIYNLLGQRVATLVDSWQPAGTHLKTWSGVPAGSQQEASSGVYIYELRAGDLKLRRKMLLLR